MSSPLICQTAALIVVVVLIVWLGDAVSAQRIIKNPIDKYVHAHTSVLFECQFDDFKSDSDQVEWCKNNFCTWGRPIELADGRLKYLSRYFIVGDRANGEFNLQIENVTSSDIGEYKCKLTRRFLGESVRTNATGIISRQEEYRLRKLTPIESKIATLQLMKPPQQISLSLNTEELNVVIGKSYQINCTVLDGQPKPDITWTFEGELGKHKNHLFKQTLLNLDDSGSPEQTPSRPTYVNQLDFSPTIDFYNQTLVCIVEHPLLKEISYKRVKLNLEYAPILKISFSQEDESGINTKSRSEQAEAASLSLENDEELRGADLDFSNRLDVFENKHYSFNCKSTSIPKTSRLSKLYLVNENGTKIEIGVQTDLSSNLRLKVDRSLNGKSLVCENENSIGRSLIHQTLNVLYSPRFVQTPEKIILLNGSDPNQKSIDKRLKLACVVDSNPAPFIYWFKNGQQLSQVGSELDLTAAVSSLDASAKKSSRFVDSLYTFSTQPLLFLSTTPTPAPFKAEGAYDGKYTCKVGSGKFKIISSTSYVISDGFPSVIGDEVFYVEEKKDLQIEFTVLSSPRLLQTAPALKFVRQASSNESARPSVASSVFVDERKFELKVIIDVDNASLAVGYQLKLSSIGKDDFGLYSLEFENQNGVRAYEFEVKLRANYGEYFIQLISYIIVGVLIFTLIILISILVCHLIRIKNEQSKFEKNQQNDSNEFGSGTCCNNIVPFEGHYGVMNNYVVGSLDSKNPSTSKSLNANAASSSTIGYSEFSFFKTALNYLNTNNKFMKAKSFLNSFRVKQASANELDKSKSSSMDIEKQASADEDDAITSATAAKVIRGANFKESPIRTINGSIKVENAEVQSITQMNGQNFLYYKSNPQQATTAASQSSKQMSEDTLNFENYAFRHDMASIYNYATKIDEKFTNQFGITTPKSANNYSSRSQPFIEYEEQVKEDDASKYVLYNSHTCSNTNLLSNNPAPTSPSFQHHASIMYSKYQTNV